MLTHLGRLSLSSFLFSFSLLLFVEQSIGAPLCMQNFARIEANPLDIPRELSLGSIVKNFFRPSIEVDTSGSWNLIYAQIFELEAWERPAAISNVREQLESITIQEAFTLINMAPTQDRPKLRIEFSDILSDALADYSLIDQFNILNQWPELGKKKPLVISEARELGELIAYNQGLLASFLARKLIQLELSAVDSKEWPDVELNSELALQVLFSFSASEMAKVSAELLSLKLEDAKGLDRVAQFQPLSVVLTDWAADKLIELMQNYDFMDVDLIRAVRWGELNWSDKKRSYAFKAFAAVVTNSLRSKKLAEMALRVDNFHALVAFVWLLQPGCERTRPERLIFFRMQETPLFGPLPEDPEDQLAWFAAQKIRNPYAREAFIAADSTEYRYLRSELTKLATRVDSAYALAAFERVVKGFKINAHELIPLVWLVLRRVNTEEQLRKFDAYYESAREVYLEILGEILS